MWSAGEVGASSPVGFGSPPVLHPSTSDVVRDRYAQKDRRRIVIVIACVRPMWGPVVSAGPLGPCRVCWSSSNMVQNSHVHFRFSATL